MSKTTAELRSELKRSLALLQTLRDEVRVRLHLGSRDLKDEWNQLEPRIEEIEKKADELSEASRAALADALTSLKRVRASLSNGG